MIEDPPSTYAMYVLFISVSLTVSCIYVLMYTCCHLCVCVFAVLMFFSGTYMLLTTEGEVSAYCHITNSGHSSWVDSSGTLFL